MVRVAYHVGFALAFSTAALAQQNPSIPITLELRGEPFDGLPAFKLLADSVVIGTGEVGEESRTFQFSAPNGLDPKSIVVNYTNDLYGGPGKDRNLVILSARIGDRQFTGDAFRAPESVGVAEGKTFRLISGGQASLARPQAGWGDSSAARVTVPTEQESKDEQKPGAATKVETDRTCPRAEPTTIAGFARNSAELPEGSITKITAVAKSAGSGCELLITGFSSRDGSATWNQKLAKLRAQEVEAALVQNGFPKDHISLDVGTDGDDAPRSAAARRVTITIK
jgi:outer membrane protein OmpA-like peptidoglycan-associated protein